MACHLESRLKILNFFLKLVLTQMNLPFFESVVFPAQEAPAIK